MKAKILNENSERTFAIIFETDDEPLKGLTKFAKEYNLTAANFTAIGAFKNVTLGYFDINKKDYIENKIDEQVEVLSMLGNIVLYKEEHKVHSHVVLGKRDGTAHGGHLLNAVVRPTLEIIVVETPSYLRRRYSEEYKIPLINFKCEK